MPEKSPETWSLVAYIWLALWGGLGGLVSFQRKVKSGVARWCNFGELIGEITASAFVGIITGLLCQAAQLHPALIWALVGIIGHMGTRALFMLETAAQRVAEKRLGISMAEAPTPSDQNSDSK